MKIYNEGYGRNRLKKYLNDKINFKKRKSQLSRLDFNLRSPVAWQLRMKAICSERNVNSP